MRPRVALGRFLVRLGRFIQSLAIMVMRPDDLVEFGRQSYSRPDQLNYWSSEELLGSGLNPLESALLDRIPIKSGKALVLFSGGGRDVFPLAQQGYDITVVEFVPEMLERFMERAAVRELHIEGLVQGVSSLQVAPNCYDLVWLSNSMYSSIPTREGRVRMLRRIRRALKPGGYFFCSFHWEQRSPSAGAERVRKIFALLTIGNLCYEPGDILWGNKEFIHAFSSDLELKSELTDGGFEVLDLCLPENGVEGGALLVPNEKALIRQP